MSVISGQHANLNSGFDGARNKSEFTRHVAAYDIATIEPNDSLYGLISDVSTRIQGADYVRSGYIAESKLDNTGRLKDDKDANADVSYIVAVPRGEDLGTIEGSYKHIAIPEGSNLSALPAYQFSQEALYVEYNDALIHAHNLGVPVVEIGALTRIEKPISNRVPYELIRDGMQKVVRGKTGEIWLITFTEKAYVAIVRAFGNEVIDVAGERVVIDKPDEHVTLVPTVIEPNKLLDNLANSIITETDPRRMKELSMTFQMMVDGLWDNEMSQPVTDLRSILREGENDE